MAHNSVKPEEYVIPLDGTPPEACDINAGDYICFTYWPGESYRPVIELCTNGYVTPLTTETINVIMTRLRRAADMTYDGPPPHVAKIITKASIMEETAMKLAIPILPTPPTYTIQPGDWKGFPVWEGPHFDIENPLTSLHHICESLGIDDA